MSALKKHSQTAHWKIVGVDNGASSYCMKEDTRIDGPWEFGLRPAQKNVKGSTKLRNATILELGVEECVRQELIPLKEYKRLTECVNLYRLNTTPAQHFPDTKGTWILGRAGFGKSHKAREMFPDPYVKPQSKWWDGYKGEKNVLIEDMDSNCLAHYLKIWGDKYACSGEVKGGTVPLFHENIVITSNYSIRYLFQEDNLVEAIERRFKVIELTEHWSVNN